MRVNFSFFLNFVVKFREINFFPKHSVENYTKVRSRFLRISLKFFCQTKAKLLQWFIYLVKPLLKIANSDFSRKFAPEILIDPNSRMSGLHDSVEKPDFYGFLQKLEAFENYQYLVRKNS